MLHKCFKPKFNIIKEEEEENKKNLLIFSLNYLLNFEIQILFFLFSNKVVRVCVCVCVCVGNKHHGVVYQDEYNLNQRLNESISLSLSLYQKFILKIFSKKKKTFVKC